MFNEPIGVFVHLYYDDLSEELAGYLSRLRCPIDLYISTDTEQKKETIEAAFLRLGFAHLTVRVFPNVGWDIAPFVVGFRNEITKHNLGLKIHGKKSAHMSSECGAVWRKHLITELIGSGDQADLAIQRFEQHQSLGLIVPSHWEEIAHWVGAGKNLEHINDLLKRMGGGALDREDHIEFPSGSMFWFRSAALAPLLALNLSWSDFSPTAPEQRDETLAHAIERAFILTTILAGFNWAIMPPTRPIASLPPSAAMQIVRDSGLFDFEYYRQKNPDVVAAGVNVVEHYYAQGHRENRNPSTDFETAYYRIIAGPELGDENPLLHYIIRGRQMGLPTKSFLEDTLRPPGRHEEMIPMLQRLADLANKLP